MDFDENLTAVEIIRRYNHIDKKFKTTPAIRNGIQTKIVRGDALKVPEDFQTATRPGMEPKLVFNDKGALIEFETTLKPCNNKKKCRPKV